LLGNLRRMKAEGRSLFYTGRRPLPVGSDIHMAAQAVMVSVIGASAVSDSASCHQQQENQEEEP